MSPFKSKVVKVIELIPYGEVASYGQIAAYIGIPRAARQVGWTLRELESKVPWWRVVNQKGIISISGNMEADRELQKKLLESEKVKVNNYKVDMSKYRFKPEIKTLQKLELDHSYIDDIFSKFSL